MKVTPKSLAALPHSGKPPVARPLTPCKDPFIHTYAIIAHADGEIDIPESHFGLDMASLGMLVGVADRFACDAIRLITNDSRQLPASALHDEAVLGL
jgi:hypothetical protein